MNSLIHSLLLGSFILLCNLTYGQEIEIGNNYFFKSTLGNLSTQMSFNGSPSTVEIKAGHCIKVVDIQGDNIYFKYWNFNNSPTLKKTYNEETNQATKIFSLKKADFKKLTSTYFNFFRGFKYGAYTLPIRLRIKDTLFEFNSNLSLGANIILGLGNRKKDYSFLDLSLGIGITKVDLNKENSDLGLIGSDFEMVELLSPAALTISLGALINLAKNVNIGLYAGWDNISSADNKAKWIYNGNTWLGVGLNVVFSSGTDASASKVSNNNTKPKSP